MHKEPDSVDRIDIGATLPPENDIGCNRIEWRETQIDTSCRRRHERGISPHLRPDPMEGLCCLTAQCGSLLSRFASLDSKPGRVCSMPGSQNGLAGMKRV